MSDLKLISTEKYILNIWSRFITIPYYLNLLSELICIQNFPFLNFIIALEKHLPLVLTVSCLCTSCAYVLTKIKMRTAHLS